MLPHLPENTLANLVACLRSWVYIPGALLRLEKSKSKSESRGEVREGNQGHGIKSPQDTLADLAACVHPRCASATRKIESGENK